MDDFSDSLLKPGIDNYLAEHISAELPVLARLSRATHLRTHMPQMLSGHVQGVFLQLISRMLQPVSILEIGTFTGYSAICLTLGLAPGGQLITIERNPELYDFALPFFREAGLEEKIRMIIGEASEIIPSLENTFDLVFIDADKDKYIEYFDMIFPKVNPGGVILADNALWYGRVVKPGAENDRETAGIYRFNQYISRLPGIEHMLLPVRDGIMFIRKNAD